jgi:hypothetical protein
MAEPQKKKPKTGRPLENVPLKTLVKRVMRDLEPKMTLSAVERKPK